MALFIVCSTRKVGQWGLATVDRKVLISVIARPIDDSKAAAKPNAPASEAKQIKWSNELELIVIPSRRGAVADEDIHATSKPEHMTDFVAGDSDIIDAIGRDAIASIEVEN